MAKLYKVRKKCMICGSVFYPKYAGSLYCDNCKNKKKEPEPAKKPAPKKSAAKKPAAKKPAVKKPAKKTAKRTVKKTVKKAAKKPVSKK